MNHLELIEKDTVNATFACALAVCGVQKPRAASMRRQASGASLAAGMGRRMDRTRKARGHQARHGALETHGHICFGGPQSGARACSVAKGGVHVRSLSANANDRSLQSV